MTFDQNSRDSIESMFDSLRKSPFVPRDSDPLPQSRPSGDGNIQPMGFLADNSVTGDVIADAALEDLRMFSDTIRPVGVVSSLPTLPSDDYPQGSTLVLTTDGKLYRNVADVWSKAVDGVDLVADSVTAGKIAAGAILTSHFAVSAQAPQVSNLAGSVVIDPTGITITDGALTFKDAFGSTVLTGVGFGPTWLDFITSMFYNGNFSAGTTTAITAATGDGTEATQADYDDAMSQDIPNWVIDSAPTCDFARVVDADAVAGFALEWSGVGQASLYQDIPITPGSAYAVWAAMKYNATTTDDTTFTGGLQWRDVNHAAIGSELESGNIFGTPDVLDFFEFPIGVTSATSPAPANARYLRVRLTLANAYAGSVFTVGSVHAELSVTRSTITSFMDADGSGAAYQVYLEGETYQRFVINANGVLSFGNGTAFPSILLSVGGSGLTLSTGMTMGGNLTLAGNFIIGGWAGFTETSNPATPAASSARMYLVNITGGKQQLRVRWDSGDITTIVTQP